MSEDYLKCYVFNHIKFCLFFLVLFLFISCQDKEWDPNIIKNPSTYRTKNNLEGETIAAKDFIKTFINCYLREVDSIVVPEFRDSLYISDSKKYEGHLISSESGSLLLLQPSDDNKLIIDFTEFPVELALMLQVDVFGKHLLHKKEDIIKAYKSTKANFTFANFKTITIEDGTFSGYNPKVFEIDSSILLLKNVGFETILQDPRDTTKNTIVKAHVDFGFLTTNTPLSYVSHLSKGLGISQARNDIINLYINSPFFRKALAHPELRKLADKIVEKESRGEKDPDFEYPLYEFEMDRKALEDLAKKKGIELSYADSVLMESQSKRQDGYFIFYYSNRFEFMIIWTCFNLFFTLVILFLAAKKFRNKTLLTIFNGFIIFINIQFFSRQPMGFNFKYLVLPFVLLVTYEIIYSNLVRKK